MRLGLDNWRSFDRGVEKEYLETNGLGGFCSSTVIGANIRKYHGLLNAALNAPTNRMMLLSKLEEEIVIGAKSYELSSSEYAQGRQMGFGQLTSFSKELYPKFVYDIGDVHIEKSIVMEYEKNTVVLLYRVRTGREKINIRFTPFLNFRDHHSVSRKGGFRYQQSYEQGALRLVEEETKLQLRILTDCSYTSNERWTEQIFYRNEAERGLEAFDYCFIPGYFTCELQPFGEFSISFVATIEQDGEIDPMKLIRREEDRRIGLLTLAGCQKPMLRELVLASDQFIVNRLSTGTKTVIAGYPWFTDWGRDTMIAFTGLTLSTGRYQAAKEILLTFVRYMSQGLLPNMFPDEGEKPIYNTADASLWFFYAVYQYLDYTEDQATVRDEIYPCLKQIIESHCKGTIFDIFMDEDGLLLAGNEGTQLTWMDVKVGNWVVTPRHGKAVEINALWYNALKIMEKLANRFGEDGSWYADTAHKAKKSFNDLFWNKDKQCLYDVIQDGKVISKLRPNQIFAVSLPFALLDKTKSRLVVERVYEKLYTPYGLRTLEKDDPEYQGSYIGDVLSRDGAYHQGTVWPWLIGPFIDAYMKVNDYSKNSRIQALEMLEEFYAHMGDACVGSISEIFDGNEPFYPRGCMAQAWSVAEVLRAYINAEKGADVHEKL